MKLSQTSVATAVLLATVAVVASMRWYRPWTPSELDIETEQFQFRPLENTSSWFSGAFCERAVLTNFDTIQSTLPARVAGAEAPSVVHWKSHSNWSRASLDKIAISDLSFATSSLLIASAPAEKVLKLTATGPVSAVFRGGSTLRMVGSGFTPDGGRSASAGEWTIATNGASAQELQFNADRSPAIIALEFPDSGQLGTSPLRVAPDVSTESLREGQAISFIRSATIRMPSASDKAIEIGPNSFIRFSKVRNVEVRSFSPGRPLKVTLVGDFKNLQVGGRDHLANCIPSLLQQAPHTQPWVMVLVAISSVSSAAWTLIGMFRTKS